MFENSINEKPLISVIMSVYNTPKEYLKRAVESIINQTYNRIELILVNDGSDDNETNKEIDRLISSYNQIVLINNESNIGLTKSLNIALKSCSGLYIARMDSDDISLPERFEKQIEYLEENPEIVLCGANIAGFSENKILYDSSLDYYRCKKSEIRDIHLLFENEGFAHSTFMLRKKFLDENNITYREEILRAQDFGLTTDCILHGGKIGLVDETLLLYRVHEGQITSNSYDSQVECQAMIGYSRIRKSFVSLSNEECWAIARINHESEKYEPAIYISAIKKIIKENKKQKGFNNYLLIRELKYEWYRKIMRMTRIIHRPWGLLRWFSVSSILCAIKLKIKDNFLKTYTVIHNKKKFQTVSNYYLKILKE